MDTLDYTLTKLDSRGIPVDRLDQWSGQHDINPPFSSQNSHLNLLRTYADKKRQCPWTQSCKVGLTLLVLLLLAWGIAVPLYFLIGPGMNLKSGSLKPVIAEPLVSSSELQAINGTVLNAVNGSMRIVNQRYTHHLGNHFSAEYQALKLKLETLLSVVFHKNSEFNKAAVTKVRPKQGTAVVEFVLIFHKNQKDVRSTVKARMLNYLAKHWSMLGTFQVDIGSLNIKNIRNRCAVDNGGCSHLCFWSILTVGYECRCPQHYQLLGDGKTCFPSVMPKATTTSNPCGEGNFACRSGSCIPHRWLCDGVSDCLLGEDEAQHMCKSLHDQVENSTQDNKRVVMSTLRARSSLHPSRPTANPGRSSTTPRIVWHRPTATARDYPIPSMAVDAANSRKKQRQEPHRQGRPNKFKYFG